MAEGGPQAPRRLRLPCSGRQASLRGEGRETAWPSHELSPARRGWSDILIRFLGEEAESVELLVTRTEQEALLLEDTLIKQYKPPHNIRLKDDKSFRMLRIDYADSFPRLKHVRAHSPDVGKEGGRSRLFGPFASASALRKTVADLHRVVPLRDCPDTVMENRSRPCLKHQIGLCSAPCVGLVTDEEYAELVQRADPLRRRGGAPARPRAQDGGGVAAPRVRARRCLARPASALRRTLEGQGSDPRTAWIATSWARAARGPGRNSSNRLARREDGGVQNPSLQERVARRGAPARRAHSALRPGRRRAPGEILLPAPPADQDVLAELLGARLLIPTTGDRRRMVEFGFENAETALRRHSDDEDREEQGLVQLVELLDLDPGTEVMDCFDISNMQGSHVVASRVRFGGATRIVRVPPLQDPRRRRAGRLRIDARGGPEESRAWCA